jgi:hypothetical protein
LEHSGAFACHREAAGRPTRRSLRKAAGRGGWPRKFPGVILTASSTEHRLLRCARNDKRDGRRRRSGRRPGPGAWERSGTFALSRSSRIASSGGFPARRSWRLHLSLNNCAGIPAGRRGWMNARQQGADNAAGGLRRIWSPQEKPCRLTSGTAVKKIIRTLPGRTKILPVNN